MDQKQELVLTQFGLDPEEVIRKEDGYWLTTEQTGIGVGYKHPLPAMSKLINRHRKELQPFITVAKMATVTGMRETTIINMDGVYTIALLANTQKAKKFRQVVVGMLSALERREFVHISQVKKWQDEVLEQLSAWKTDLLDLKVSRYIEAAPNMDKDKYRRMLRYRAMGLSQKDTGKLLDVSKDVIHRAEKVVHQFDMAVGPLAMIPA